MKLEGNTAKGNTKLLEDNIDKLTDEYSFYFLGVLEALNFAQNAREMEGEETVNQVAGSR